MPNRLIRSASPYLLQHADNPVDWWEWGEEAFAQARRRDVPVLLSVGYAACHWCHVMAHESFEDPEIAALLAEHFVAIKVDREERPDVDAVYLAATQAMTGHGGWPMTCFLTPAGDPFLCGTYFPPRPRPGLPSFRQVVEAVAGAWRERRAEVLGSAAQATAELGRQVFAPPAAGARPPTAEDLAAARTRLQRSYDAEHGGFGAEPKFPPSMVLEWLLRRAATGDGDARTMAMRTLAAMARGGIYDQLAGGFARYSVDQAWVVPHFEKMLYDNALLLRVYAHAWRDTGDPLCRRVTAETADFLVADLRTAQGGFASSLDADAGGVEGLTYAWTPDQLLDVLGAQDGRWAAALLGVTDAGTFEHGASTLQLPADPGDPARWVRVRAALRAARARRPQPARDDKVVAAWNGLAIAALADAGVLLDRGDLLTAATAAATLLCSVHLVDGRLRRVSRDGRAGEPPGVVEDYADLAEGLLALHATTGDPRWLAHAGRLLDTVLDHAGDGAGGVFDTLDDAPPLVHRPRDPADNATPAAATATAGALLSYAAATGSSRHREAADALLAALAPLAGSQPRFVGWGLAVAEAALAGPVQVAVVGPVDDPLTRALADVARRSASPGLVLAVGPPDTPGVPLLAGRPLVAGAPAAYVCRGFVCDAPVTSPAALAAALSRPA